MELASQLNPGADETAIDRAAIVMELTHVASLYHDDVMDEAEVRRGVPSANSRWDNTVAIMVGDFLFARAFELMVETDSLRALGILARASAVIAEGEVLQLTRAHDLNLDLDTYLQIIRAKTAELFAAAAEAAPLLPGGGQADAYRLLAAAAARSIVRPP